MAYDNYKGWAWLTGDCDWVTYGGCWYKKSADGALWVLRFCNREDYGDGAKGYDCDVLRVKLEEVAVAETISALRSCGWKFEMEDGEPRIVCPHDGTTVASGEAVEPCLLSCLIGYGTYAPMGEHTSNWPDRARCASRRDAEGMMADTAVVEARLDKPFNAIGTTQREAAQGDILAGLKRTAQAVMLGEEPDVHSAIALKMFAASKGQTLGGTVETELALAGELLREEN